MQYMFLNAEKVKIPRLRLVIQRSDCHSCYNHVIAGLGEVRSALGFARQPIKGEGG